MSPMYARNPALEQEMRGWRDPWADRLWLTEAESKARGARILDDAAVMLRQVGRADYNLSMRIAERMFAPTDRVQSQYHLWPEQLVLPEAERIICDILENLSRESLIMACRQRKTTVGPPVAYGCPVGRYGMVDVQRLQPVYADLGPRKDPQGLIDRDEPMPQGGVMLFVGLGCR